MKQVSSETFLKLLETGEVRDKVYEVVDGRNEYVECAIPDEVTMVRDAVYGSVNGRDLHLDAFYREEKPSSPRPAIVFIHGGGFVGGSKIKFYPMAIYFALVHNFFAVSIDYRLGQEAIFPAAVQDSKCAVRWVRSVAEKYSIDPDKIIVSGGSGGGNLSAMIATTENMPEFEGDGGHNNFSSRANLSIPCCGVFDLCGLAPHARTLDTYLGGPFIDKMDLYYMASPINHVNSKMPPALYLHGGDDGLARGVRCLQSIDMYRKHWELGVPAEIEIYEGKPHGWFHFGTDCLPTLKRMESFIFKYF